MPLRKSSCSGKASAQARAAYSPFNTAVFTLEGGQIVIVGLFPEGQNEAPFAVVGGTGTYASAQGDGIWTNTEEKDDFVIHLAA